MDRFEVVRSKRDFTTISNQIFRDSNLSLKARGLLCTALSLPPDWSFSIRGLVAICKDGTAAIMSALKELEEAAYLRRDQLQAHQENGTFGGVKYTFYEAPCSGFPYTDKPYTENRSQLNTKQSITKLSPPISPPEGEAPEGKKPAKPARQKRSKSVPDWEPELFERFWALYPRHEDRRGAVMEWDKLQPGMTLMQRMSAALKRQTRSDEWQRGIGIPYAVRWLRHRRWEDDPLPAAARDAPGEFIPEVSEWH